MPFKKRKVDKEAVHSQYSEEKDDDENEDQVPKSSSNRKKRNFAQSFIIISDSDGEEGKEQNGALRKRSKTQTVRDKLEAKRRIIQMTEEEQLELAVRMSKQEASQQQEEEELLRKVIAQSLNSGQISKSTGKGRGTSRRAAEEHTELSQQQEEAYSGGSATTCPDSLPPSEPHSQSPITKPNSQPLSGASCPTPIRKPVSPLLSHASAQSTIRKPASQPLYGSRSPVRNPATQPPLSGASCSPIRNLASQPRFGASCLSPVKSASQPLSGASCLSPATKSASQPLSSASCLSPVTKSASQPLSGASCLSPVTKSASQPLSGVSCLSPVTKSASQPLSGISCLSPISKSASQPLGDLESHLSIWKCAASSPPKAPKSPMVVLQRLSQDFVESASVILSPARSGPSSALCKDPPSPALTDSSDFVPMSPFKNLVTLSPTFPRKSPSPWQLAPRRLIPSSVKSQRMQDECLEKLSDPARSPGSESTSGSSTPGDLVDLQGSGILEHCVSPRPVCDTHTKETMGTPAPQALKPLSLGAPQEQCPKLEDEGTVHYYWGVPFCPKGGNPNQYTKVILCQLEVYQKSLKQAQRQLLQKREYGPPIVPIPPSLRRSNRCRADEKEEESQDIAWGERGSQEEPMSDNSRESSQSPAVEERAAPTEDGPTTSYMQPPSSQAMCVEETPDESAGEGEPTQGTPSASAMSCDGLQGSPGGAGCHEKDEKEEEKEGEEVTICPETQPCLSSDADTEKRDLPSAENASPAQSDAEIPAQETENVAPPATVADVECPLCGRGFAQEQIELHAAYCDGGALKPEQKPDAPVLTRRQRGMRSTAVDLGELLSSDTGKTALRENLPILQFPGLGKCEKCYVCKELVPLREYQGHVDSCLQTAVMETQGSRRLRCTKEVGRSEGRLLSMLDQSESMSAGAEARISAPGPVALRLCPSEADEEEEAAGHSRNQPSSPEDFATQLHLSNSPIKSFVSISEATDCLVDFKQQFTKGPSTRAGRGHGRGPIRRSRSRGWRGKRR